MFDWWLRLPLRARDIQRALLALIGVAYFVGCATIPLAEPELDAASKQFSVPTGTANLYVVRNGGYMSGGMVLFRVLVDGKDEGSLADQTFLVVSVGPGRHLLAALSSESQESVSIDAEEGHNYFVGIKARIGWASGRVSVSRLSEDEGKAAVISARLSRGVSIR